MGLLSGLFKRKEQPQASTPGSPYKPLYGGTASGEFISERSAMQVTAVYACVRVIAETIAGLPLHLYETDRDGTSAKKAIDKTLYFLLHDEPNPEMTAFNFRETMMTHLLLWGNAYIQVIRNNRGEVVALYPLMPKHMTVDRDENNQIVYEYWVGPDELPIQNRKYVLLRPNQDVLHIPGLGYDGLVGYSPIAMAKNAIGLSLAAEKYGASFFKNGATPSGVLEHPGVIKEPEKLRESWMSAYGGSSNAGRVAILEEGMKYTPISISPEEAQFLDTRKFQVDEIARIFRVPPHMIGDLEHATFSNIEHQSLEFVQYTLDPWLIRWEQSLNRALLTTEEKKRFYFKFNVDGLLRGDYQSRMAGYATGIQNGIMSVNDVRRLENMDLLSDEEGGNLHLLNGNMIPLAQAGAAYGVDSTGATAPTQEDQSAARGGEKR